MAGLPVVEPEVHPSMVQGVRRIQASTQFLMPSTLKMWLPEINRFDY